MAYRISSTTALLQKAWKLLNRLPAGIWAFNCILRLINPYTATIKASVTDLKPGYARVKMSDRRRVRNHLNSIHAIALTNLGEFTSGLALLMGLPESARGIPVKISIDFLKKARGQLTAECHTRLPGVINESVNFDVSAEIRDRQGDIVARTLVTWRLGPEEKD